VHERATRFTAPAYWVRIDLPRALGDAPWPPHYKKQRNEPPRVAPSRRKASGPSTERRGHRESTQPLITVAKAARKADVLAGLERWKARYQEAAARLHVDDVR